MSRLSLTLIPLAAGFLVANGCSSSVKLDANVPVCVMDEHVLDTGIPLRATEILDSDEFMYANGYYVYRDSILIVDNKADRDSYALEFYRLGDRTAPIRRFLRKGNGPGEILSVKSVLDCEKLVVRDIVKKNIFEIAVDSVLCDADYRPGEFVRYGGEYGMCTGAIFRDDSTLILLNPYYLENDEMRIHNGESPFLIERIGCTSPVTYHDRMVKSANIYQGSMIYNAEKECLVFASLWTDELRIYDAGLNLKKQIRGPVVVEPRYTYDKSDEVKSLVFSKGIPYGYVCYCKDKDGFWLVFYGRYGVYDEKNPLGVHILQFDWGGNLLKVYNSTKNISRLSKSSRDDTFYASGKEDGLVKLWKLSPEVGQ